MAKRIKAPRYERGNWGFESLYARHFIPGPSNWLDA